MDIDGAAFLAAGEEFKIIVPVMDVRQAQTIIAQRERHRVFRNLRTDGVPFDFDETTKCLWLLAPNFPVVKQGQWNQNNIFQ